jgi:hypothetical protein
LFYYKKIFFRVNKKHAFNEPYLGQLSGLGSNVLSSPSDPLLEADGAGLGDLVEQLGSEKV